MADSIKGTWAAALVATREGQESEECCRSLLVKVYESALCHGGELLVVCTCKQEWRVTGAIFKPSTEEDGWLGVGAG